MKATPLWRLAKRKRVKLPERGPCIECGERTRRWLYTGFSSFRGYFKRFMCAQCRSDAGLRAER